MKYLILILLLLLPFSAGAVSSVPYEDLRCLTENIYFEARGEPILGQALVGHSVINRMKDRRWADSICGVVYQKSQYSWTLEKKKPIEDRDTYVLISNLAYALLANKDSQDITGVTNYLRCDWRHKVDWWKEMTFLGQIGAHCFYRDE